MAFRLRDEGLAFVENAPTVLRYSTTIRATPQQVFDALSGDPASWRHWFPGFRDGSYDSPPPHGVGSLRRVSVTGAGTYRETIVAWDEPHRWAWRVDSTTMPMAKALVEQWTMRPDGAGTEVTWTFAVDPMPWFGIGLRVAPTVMQQVFNRAMRKLEQRLLG